MKKKKYVAPEISVIEMDPLQIMAGSLESDRGWSPDGDERMDSASRKKRMVEIMNSKFYIAKTL